MTFEEVMERLEGMGTAQNRKIYKRHGAGAILFGVSFANLKILKKKINTDHDLALKLWQTGNTDARTLAVMVVEPVQVDRELLEEWLADISYYMLVDIFVSNVAGKTPFAREKAEEWSASDDEWRARAGWALINNLSQHDQEIPDQYFEEKLKQIEGNIHGVKNRIRESMNMALIAIGIRNSYLETLALRVAAKIGKVEVNHGNTSCKTPDAESYIKKTLARKNKKIK